MAQYYTMNLERIMKKKEIDENLKRFRDEAKAERKKRVMASRIDNLPTKVMSYLNLGYSQTKTAKIIGISQQTVSKIKCNQDKCAI